MALNIAPALQIVGAWRLAWWAGALLALGALIFMLVVFKQPLTEALEPQGSTSTTRFAASPPTAAPTRVTGAMASALPDYKSLIFVVVAFLLYNYYISGAVLNFYPIFLERAHGMDIQAAGSFSSIRSIVALVISPIVGLISDKFSLRKGLIIIGIVGICGLLTIVFSNNLSLVWLALCISSFFFVLVPIGTLAIIPRLVKDPQKLGFGMALFACCQNAGMMIGSASFGPASAALGWQTASLVALLPAAVISLVLILFVRETRKAHS
jgi:MFS family permease